MKSIKLLMLLPFTGLLFSCAQTSVQKTDAELNTQNPTVAVSTERARKKPNVSSQAAADYRPAIAAMDAQQWQKAEVLLQEMSVRYPRLMSVRVNLAIVYRQQQRADEAIAELEKAVAYKKIYRSDAHNLLAIMQREKGDFKAAESVYLDAIKQWPSNALLPRNLGILYDLYLDEPSKALAAYEQAKALLPEPDKALNRWIKALQRKVKASTQQKTSNITYFNREVRA